MSLVLHPYGLGTKAYQRKTRVIAYLLIMFSIWAFQVTYSLKVTARYLRKQTDKIEYELLEQDGTSCFELLKKMSVASVTFNIKSHSPCYTLIIQDVNITLGSLRVTGTRNTKVIKRFISEAPQRYRDLSVKEMSNSKAPRTVYLQVLQTSLEWADMRCHLLTQTAPNYQKMTQSSYNFSAYVQLKQFQKYFSIKEIIKRLCKTNEYGICRARGVNAIMHAFH